MTDEELCGWLRSMLPASGFAPTENWAPWLGADRIEALEAEVERLRVALSWAEDADPVLVDAIRNRAGLKGY